MACQEGLQLTRCGASSALDVRLRGRFVRLQLSRPFRAAFSDLPVLEVGAEAYPKQQAAKRSGDCRNAVRQAGCGLGSFRAVVFHHQVSSGRQQLEQELKETLDSLGANLEIAAAYREPLFRRGHFDPIVAWVWPSVVQANEHRLAGRRTCRAFDQEPKVTGAEAAVRSQRHEQPAAGERFALQRG